MRFATHLFVLFFLFSTVHNLYTRDAVAAGEFQTDYRVTYSVEPSGKTNVTQEISLKNKTTNFYADKFELKMGSTKVENVQARDLTGPMETDVKFEDNITAISVKFNQRIIGLDKTLPWTLTYSSNELASKSGQIWEISIPKVADAGDIGSYEAGVSVPTSFGLVAFAVPTPLTTTKDAKTQKFTFDKPQLTKSGIAMSFGEKQVFYLNLNYYLENKNLTNQYQEISLPPDNNYQKVVLERLEPPPEDVTIDTDGNFQARYKLTPKEKLDVSLAGYVEVFSKPTRNIYAPLSPAERDRYTQSQKYWEIDDAFIQNKANELKTPQNIYEFVTNYLTYDQDRLKAQKLERKGAAGAVSEPNSAVCTEFTDLFITIARSAGIPAREVEGYAYTQNERLRPLSLALLDGDILHAWPEYWDDNLGWVQIDPTWGSTSGGLDYFNKMDFNHVTFVQRGVSSTNPHPAGAYKREENTIGKTVFVSFAQDLPSPTSIVDLKLTAPPKIISGIPAKILAQVANVGSTSIFDASLTLATGLKVQGDATVKLGIMPPFAKKDLEYRVQTNNFTSRQIEPISLILGDEFVTKSVSIIPIYFLLVSPNFLAGTVLAVLIIVAGFYLYRRFHLKNQKI